MLIDAVVHPLMRRNDVLQSYMREPMRRLFAPGSLRSMYPAPTGTPPHGEFLDSSRPEHAGPLDLPGSEPEMARAHLRAQGVDRAILVPLTRGLSANTNHNTAICAATNDWLAETWLIDPLFLGSICVNPRDPEAAVGEIERWAGHDRVVQVVVPMLVHQPYGVRAYHPIWEAAVAHGLPVAIRQDGGTGLEYPPTPVGYPRSFTEFATLASSTFANHLASFIAEGAFDRFPDLRVVFTDGGHDLLTSMVWRLDTTIPACRGETPWVTGMPSDYIEPHVRFATARMERPPLDAGQLAEWMRMSRGADLLLYGSHHPHWTSEGPDDVLPELDEGVRRRLLGENAAAFYGARLAAASTP
jgi:predicted TIM-barrel fold metal-dependent hydrolase